MVTAGGGAQEYRSGGGNNRTMSELLRPYQQSARFCGMIWQPPHVVHSVLPASYEGHKNLTDEELAAAARGYRQLLEERLTPAGG